MAFENLVKRALADSAKQIFRVKAFSKVSIADICDNAGVSRRSFYTHFKDKYDLVNEVFYEEYHSKFNFNNHADPIWTRFQTCCEYVYADRAYYKNVLSVTGTNSLSEYGAELLYPEVVGYYGEILETNPITNRCLEMFLKLLFVLIHDWLNTNPCITPDKFTEKVKGAFYEFFHSYIDKLDENA